MFTTRNSLDPVTLFVAIVPGLLLLLYIYKQDKREKEPPELLAKLFLFGVLSVPFAILLERILQSILLSGFTEATNAYYFIQAFLCIALVEEGLKFVFLKFGTWNHPSFNYTFDGIVYAVFVSLGFAIIENIMYVSRGGINVGLMRAILSIPGHMCFVIPMGIYYSQAKRLQLRGYPYGTSLFIGVFLAVAAHGLYDYALMINDTTSFILIVIVMYLVMFYLINLHGKTDQRL